MLKIIVPKLFYLFVFLFFTNSIFSQGSPCSTYDTNRLIIETYDGSLGPNEIGGTQAFTDFGGNAVDVIIGESYTVYLVEFALPNNYFYDIEETLGFFGCGDTIGPSGGIVKVRKADLNYHIKNTSGASSGGGIYKYSSYSLFSECENMTSFQGSGPLVVSSPLTVAFVDSGHLPGTPYDDHVLMDYGYDFANDDPIPNGPDPHGTYVSSITAGIAHSFMSMLNIVPVQILDEVGECDLFTFYKGFNHAAEIADIINLSVGAIICEIDLCSVIFDDMLLEAEENNRLVIAAAGNDGLPIDYDLDNDNYYHIPGSCQAENLIVTGSSFCFETPSQFTNIGPLNVDLLVPGENIIAYPNALATGTSFSAPQVTAVAAIMGLDMQNFKASTIKCSILESTVFRDWDSYCLTGGSLNYDQLTTTPSCRNSLSTLPPYPTYRINPKDSKTNIEISILSNTTLSIDIDASIAQNAIVKIMDLSGRPLMTEKLHLQKGQNHRTLSLEQMGSSPLGLYLISVFSDNEGTSTYQWLKTH